MSELQQPKAAAPKRKKGFRFFGGKNSSKRRGRPGGVRRWLEKLPDHLVDRKLNLYQVAAMAIVGVIVYFVLMPLIGDWNPSAPSGE
jgi:hypothetical protein